MADIRDWQRMSKIFEKQKPNWIPGENVGYHFLTFGWLVDQLIRRIDPKKRSLSQFFKEEVAEPYSMFSFFFLNLNLYLNLNSVLKILVIIFVRNATFPVLISFFFFAINFFYIKMTKSIWIPVEHLGCCGSNQMLPAWTTLFSDLDLMIGAPIELEYRIARLASVPKVIAAREVVEYPALLKILWNGFLTPLLFWNRMLRNVFRNFAWMGNVNSFFFHFHLLSIITISSFSILNFSSKLTQSEAFQ